MAGGCSTFTGMCGSGATTCMDRSTAQPQSATPWDRDQARADCCGAGRSSILRRTSIPATVTTLNRRTGTTTVVSVRRELTTYPHDHSTPLRFSAALSTNRLPAVFHAAIHRHLHSIATWHVSVYPLGLSVPIRDRLEQSRHEYGQEGGEEEGQHGESGL